MDRFLIGFVMAALAAAGVLICVWRWAPEFWDAVAIAVFLATHLWFAGLPDTKAGAPRAWRLACVTFAAVWLGFTLQPLVGG